MTVYRSLRSIHKKNFVSMDSQNLTAAARNCTDIDAYTKNALFCTPIAVAVAILVILSFTYKRVRLYGRYFSGYPGIVVPINLLTVTLHRGVYVAVFGAMSGDILAELWSLLFHVKPLLPLTSDPYWNVFIQVVLSPAVIVLYLSAKYVPLFACVDVPLLEVGHFLGLFYSCFLITIQVYGDVNEYYCQFQNNHFMLGIALASRSSVYVCYLIIIVWYSWSVLRNTFLMCYMGISNAMNHIRRRENNYYSDHVKSLLKKKMPNDGLCCMCPCIFSPWKLPLKFMGALVIALIILYQLTLILFAVLMYDTTVLSERVEYMGPTIISTLKELNISTEVYEDLVIVLHGLQVVLPVGPLASFVFCLIVLVHMVASFYKQLGEVARGSFSFPRSYPSIQVSASWRYAGYQISFFFAAFATYTLVLWLLGLLGILALLGFKHYRDVMCHLLALLLMSLGWIGFVYASQVILCKILFVRSGGGKFVVITNKRLFHWFSYTLFIYNAIIGLFMAVVRLLLSSLFSLLLLIRMDRIILMKGFEFWDFSHKTYIGSLALEHTYNNAVVQTFVRLMVDSLKERERVESAVLFGGRPPDQDSMHEAAVGLSVQSPFLNGGPTTYGTYPARNNPTDEKDLAKSRQARNRWLVAYTLLKNPSLQELTASRLNENEP